ncbi:MAG: hypothetical protein K6T83_15485, partial [Alicyclobacillus sp.]|nr:hypothetical protein [Alicyclobacillus sp.]
PVSCNRGPEGGRPERVVSAVVRLDPSGTTSTNPNLLVLEMIIAVVGKARGAAGRPAALMVEL